MSRETFRGVLRAGADLERAIVSAKYEGQAAQNARRDRVGLFVTGGWTLSRRYHLSAGLRRGDIRDVSLRDPHGPPASA